ncbi:MAG: hypothetical protein GON13_03610 [Nanoarchaeota archaeon]|nr:hypothetical protein [Nanoarchaeota archaeon]
MKWGIVLLSALIVLMPALAITSETLLETADAAAVKINTLNITTEFDGMVKPLLPFTGELLIIDNNASVQVTIMQDFSVRVNDNRNSDVLVKIDSINFNKIYDAVMKDDIEQEELISLFNNASVVIVPKSIKAETGVSLIKKFTPLEFTIEKEKGVAAVVRSFISTIVSGVISFFAGLAGY